MGIQQKLDQVLRTLEYFEDLDLKTVDEHVTLMEKLSSMVFLCSLDEDVIFK